MHEVRRRASDHDRREPWEVEVIGGPADGTRLFLDVVRDALDQIRVLEKGYTRGEQPVMASEVERQGDPPESEQAGR